MNTDRGAYKRPGDILDEKYNKKQQLFRNHRNDEGDPHDIPEPPRFEKSSSPSLFQDKNSQELENRLFNRLNLRMKKGYEARRRKKEAVTLRESQSGSGSFIS